MSEKRFILAEDSNGLFSIFDNEDPEDEPLIYAARFGTEKVCDLLNELVEKNEILIFDFCKWLGSQGLLYEVIYYGDYDEIKETIDKYLAEQEADDE